MSRCKAGTRAKADTIKLNEKPDYVRKWRGMQEFVKKNPFTSAEFFKAALDEHYPRNVYNGVQAAMHSVTITDDNCTITFVLKRKEVKYALDVHGVTHWLCRLGESDVKDYLTETTTISDYLYASYSFILGEAPSKPTLGFHSSS